MISKNTFKHIKIEQEDSVLVVSLATGNKANCLCVETLNELHQLATHLSTSNHISSVLVKSSESVFCGGMNLTDRVVSDFTEFSLSERRQIAALGGKVCRAWEDLGQITFAVIEGACVGGGVALTLSLDLRICSSNSLIYVPEIERGLNMSWQSVPRSVNLIGPSRTKRMLLLAEKVSAEQAFDWGWADYLTTAGEAENLAKDLAAKVSAMPKDALQMCKQSINVAANALNHAVSFMDADQLLLCQHSEEYTKAIDSFKHENNK